MVIQPYPGVNRLKPPGFIPPEDLITNYLLLTATLESDVDVSLCKQYFCGNNYLVNDLTIATFKSAPHDHLGNLFELYEFFNWYYTNTISHTTQFSTQMLLITSTFYNINWSARRLGPFSFHTLSYLCYISLLGTNLVS